MRCLLEDECEQDHYEALGVTGGDTLSCPVQAKWDRWRDLGRLSVVEQQLGVPGHPFGLR